MFLSNRIYLTKRKKKKILKIIILLIAVIVIATILIIKFYPTSKINLKNKGFSETEVSWIQNLSKETQEYFLATEELYPLLKEKNFQVSNFSEYIAFYQKNNNLSFYELVMVVNHGLQNSNIEIIHDVLEFFYTENFEPNRLTRYIAYQNENSELEKEKIILFVNQDIDEVICQFEKMYVEDRVAFEAYQQLMMDEELQIFTVNNFLKAMQMVEGIERLGDRERIEKEFKKEKHRIMKKLTDEKDKEFVKIYP